MSDRLHEVAQPAKPWSKAMPEFQIIRTVEELEALDPMAIVQPNPSGDFQHEVVRAESLLYVVSRWGWKYRLPAAVIATGGQVRAARESLEKEHG